MAKKKVYVCFDYDRDKHYGMQIQTSISHLTTSLRMKYNRMIFRL